MKDSKNTNKRSQNLSSNNQINREKQREANKIETKKQIATTSLNQKANQQLSKSGKSNTATRPLTSKTQNPQNDNNSKNTTTHSSKVEQTISKRQNSGVVRTEGNKKNQNKNEIKINEIQKSVNKEQNQIVETQNKQQQINENINQEKTPKIEFDNKTIKTFMPYFEKNMSYTKKLAKNEMKVIMLYDKKIDELINIYTFTEKYLYFITQTFKKISQPFYYVLTCTYLKDIKPYFAYFKNLVTIFETFSDNLKTLGHSIKHSSTEDENTNMSELMNVEFDLNKSVEKLNLIYADIFSIITNNLKENVLNKPLYNKVEAVEPKFWENERNMEKLTSKLEHRRDKLMNKYKKEYEQLFCYYKDRKQKESPELFNDLVCMKDFLFIEYDLVSYCNKAFIKIRKFLKDIEVLLNDSTNLFCDYLEALKTMIKIYYDENRFIINPNILSTSMISNLDKLIEQDIRKNIEKKLSIKNIIEFAKETKLRNEMNHLLLNYRDILIQSQILKDKNKIIDEITNFNLHNFKRTSQFFSFLDDLVPPIIKFNFSNYIQLKTTIKRDAGIIKKWKNTLLTVTYQGHILLLDEVAPTSNSEKIKEQPIKEEKKKETENENKINEEKKINNDIIVKDELSEGILPNKLVYMYLKTSYGIFGTGKKDDKYLFQLWAFYNGNKKNKQLNVDALSQENLTQIINVLNDNNDMNLTQINQ